MFSRHFLILAVSLAVSLLQLTSANPVPALTEVLPPSRMASTLLHFQSFLYTAFPSNSSAVNSSVTAAFSTMYSVVEGTAAVQPRSPFQPLTNPADPNDPLHKSKVKKPLTPADIILSRTNAELPPFVSHIDQLLCAMVQCYRPSWVPCAPDDLSCPLWPGYPSSLPPLLSPADALAELQALLDGTLPIPHAHSRRPAELLTIAPEEMTEALGALADFIATWRAEFDAGSLVVRDQRAGASLEKRLKFEMTENEVMFVAGAVLGVAICAGSGGLCAAALLAAITFD